MCLKLFKYYYVSEKYNIDKNKSFGKTIEPTKVNSSQTIRNFVYMFYLFDNLEFQCDVRNLQRKAKGRIILYSVRRVPYTVFGINL